jgi:hypothetical protein
MWNTLLLLFKTIDKKNHVIPTLYFPGLSVIPSSVKKPYLRLQQLNLLRQVASVAEEVRTLVVMRTGAGGGDSCGGSGVG